VETPFGLDRFGTAQEDAYDSILAELRTGRKDSHWIWFIFPQVAGLGRSWSSQKYSIVTLDEARAYLAHPVLGRRLRECVEVILSTRHRSAEQIFGSLDAMKLRSSMTLFHRAAPDEPLFQQALDHYFDGIPDDLTDARLAERS